MEVEVVVGVGTLDRRTKGEEWGKEKMIMKEEVVEVEESRVRVLGRERLDSLSPQAALASTRTQEEVEEEEKEVGVDEELISRRVLSKRCVLVEPARTNERKGEGGQERNRGEATRDTK